MLSVFVCVCGYECVIPVKEINVTENSKTRIQCDVPFALPHDIEVIWRFAEEVCFAGVTLPPLKGYVTILETVQICQTVN